MPRIDFSPENKVETGYDFPTLKLKKGDRARILCIEEKPEMVYRHVLRAPAIENGQPKYETVENFGKTSTQVVKDFVGSPICLGSLQVIDQKGYDPDGCVVCAAVDESEGAVERPERRFAMHVVRYATKPGSFDVAEPFSASLVAWAFSDKIFAKLTDYRTEHGDLRLYDLRLGPCTVEKFQRFDIEKAGQAEWLKDGKDGARAQYVIELYQNNQAKDLERVMGRKLSAPLMKEDVEKVLVRHRIAFGTEATPEMASEVSDALAGLLDDSPTVPIGTAGEESQSSPQPDEPEAPENPADVEVPEPAEDKEELVLDDILNL